ncbi:hypothetical protein OVY01_13980 [Robbsia sp. Bb-Pol-6]|uniref:Uncharacterized protein n=2 Tax=Robbsia betulipollinis TaxID=2981849 RepID=A0ABT3ZP60_9BURK|nr:hypothetical protein [Robbsia betulipollinis]
MARAADIVRHTAHGVEITSREIRLIRLSRSAASARPVREDGRCIQVDDAVRHPLPPGIVVGADIVDPEALSRALNECFSQQAARLAQRAAPLAACGALDAMPEVMPNVMPNVMPALPPERAASGGAVRIALALCPSVVAQGTVALDELIPGFSMRLPGRLDEAAFDALEPWVSLHAQKISGIDPGELIVDWYPVVSGDPERVVVAATQRHYLDIRQGVADAAGLHLGALCDASIAALDACRFVVAQCLHTRCDDVDVVSSSPVIGGACFSPAPARSQPPQRAQRGAHARWAPATSATLPEAQRLVAEARRAYADGGGALPQAAEQRFAALWLGERAWRAWAFTASGATLEEWVLPDPRDPAALVAALREQAGELALTLVAGECDVLAPVGGLRALGSALCCPVIEFDASTCCRGPAATSQQLGPAASVAFGLAFRELLP